MPRELPRVEIKPVVWNLHLVSINDLLLEDAVTVPQAIAPGWVVQRRKTVEEARSEASQPAIAEGSIVFLLDDILDPEPQLGETSLGTAGLVYALFSFPYPPLNTNVLKPGRSPTFSYILGTDIEHRVVERPPHEELQAEVVDTLAVGVGLALLGPVPLQDQPVAEGQARGGVGSRLVAVEHAPGQGGLDVADDLLLEAILVLEPASLVLEPCLTLWFGDRGCLDMGRVVSRWRELAARVGPITTDFAIVS